ncbi:DUF3365 domain-containing protein [Prosthecobacter sp.]|uniref:c-type heme family protein n=1 Tax=Prosthecobacter sp. TaxID=1965333 RepID=UPI00248743ED|nr:DUF3365 domain-containing protein [Prosthecobacter sp.]MDI1311017.1 DUF3365 domain-containing protein [Prosthecobacter sp.]
MEHRIGPPRGTVGMRSLLACLIGAGVAAGALWGQDHGKEQNTPPPKVSPAVAKTSAPATVAAARAQAKLLQEVYTTTLEAMHRHYFRRDGAVLPARALEDVFASMAKLSGSNANWIAVNTKAMNIDHEPTTSFEKKAAAALAAGKEDYEVVTERMYRRATVIPLHSNCVGCHTKMFDDPPKTPRFAGLVISISLSMMDKSAAALKVAP